MCVIIITKLSVSLTDITLNNWLSLSVDKFSIVHLYIKLCMQRKKIQHGKLEKTGKQLKCC